MNIEVWLTELGLEQYANAFAKNGIDLSLLPELTNEDLKDLGIDRLVDRKTILKAIARASETALEPTEDTIARRSRTYRIEVRAASTYGSARYYACMMHCEHSWLKSRYSNVFPLLAQS